MIGLGHYLAVAAILFTLGVAGIILNRKNIIIILMSVELILLSVNINLVAFFELSRRSHRPGLRVVHPDGRGGGSGDRPRHPRDLLPQSRIDRGRRHQCDERLSMVTVVVALPLLGFLIAGLFGKQIGVRASELVTTTFLMVSALLSWVLFIQHALGSQPETVALIGSWFSVGALKVDWALRVDALTAVMLVVVNTVSALVHLYSMGYMHEDPARPRFFAYLSLFTFTMLMLVTSDNLVQMFFGWEGVGLASYLLIGFWYYKPTANAAAIKAFVVNRVGDFGFLLGIFAVFLLTKSVFVRDDLRRRAGARRQASPRLRP